MARVTLTPTALVTNSGVADPAGTASVAGTGNGFTVPPATSKGALVVFLRVSNATAGAGTVTVLAGTQPSAQSSGQGASTVSVAATTGVQWLGPFESARFEQADGSLSVETSVVLTVTAFSLDHRRI